MSVHANTENANARKDQKIAVAAEANHTIVPQSAKRGVKRVTIADSKPNHECALVRSVGDGKSDMAARIAFPGSIWLLIESPANSPNF